MATGDDQIVVLRSMLFLRSISTPHLHPDSPAVPITQWTFTGPKSSALSRSLKLKPSPPSPINHVFHFSSSWAPPSPLFSIFSISGFNWFVCTYKCTSVQVPGYQSERCCVTLGEDWPPAHQGIAKSFHGLGMPFWLPSFSVSCHCVSQASLHVFLYQPPLCTQSFLSCAQGYPSIVSSLFDVSTLGCELFEGRVQSWFGSDSQSWAQYFANVWTQGWMNKLVRQWTTTPTHLCVHFSLWEF